MEASGFFNYDGGRVFSHNVGLFWPNLDQEQIRSQECVIYKVQQPSDPSRQGYFPGLGNASVEYTKHRKPYPGILPQRLSLDITVIAFRIKAVMF